MSQLKLRPYQEECLKSIQEHFERGVNRQLVHLPTGAGKTVIFANLIKNMECKTLVLAHTCELLDQAKEKIEMFCPGLDVGIVNSQKKQFEASVVISSIQAASQPATLHKLHAAGFQLLIADECHHFAAESPRKVLSFLGFGKGTKQLLVGFTATPFRSDGKGLAEVFEAVTYQKKIKDMISEGYLCSPKGLKVATDLDLSTVKTIDGGDFQASSLAAVMDTPEMNHIVADAYLKSANGHKAICFGVSIQHAKNLSDTFQKCGVTSGTIHGRMSHEERVEILSQYRSDSIDVLCNCQVLTEGFDAPETSCVIVARPTKSRGLYQQMIGRGLRLWPNKHECIVLDFSDANHSICSTAVLLEDAEYETYKTRPELDNSKKELLKKLPPNLNKKLKTAIINIDMIGESFTWEHEGNVYSMLGAGRTRLSILPDDGTDRFSVILTAEHGQRTIASGITFEYAFAAAEGFAKENRKIFAISDVDAPWRDSPISDKQLFLLRSKGYRAGIGNLTRGQASLLIGSGALP